MGRNHKLEKHTRTKVIRFRVDPAVSHRALVFGDFGLVADADGEVSMDLAQRLEAQLAAQIPADARLWMRLTPRRNIGSEDSRSEAIASVAKGQSIVEFDGLPRDAAVALLESFLAEFPIPCVVCIDPESDSGAVKVTASRD